VVAEGGGPLGECQPVRATFLKVPAEMPPARQRGGVVVALITASGCIAAAFSPTPALAGMRCHPAGGPGEPKRASRWPRNDVNAQASGDSGEGEATGGDRAMPRRAVLVSAAVIAAAAAAPPEAAHCETQVCTYVEARCVRAWCVIE